ncbi:Gfo/Idh/MocA family oxidoreductase [Rhizobium sp. NLR17b]|uniref:Gfo/Idh/MocA family protein n=1 Tax=Rhizobium sp. NLR17b TaxID=2731114 RepID=UPI001C83233F|nr:Gfo/Idh/MocA family oxidoreductase [Rhizobium sp. NLR17b]MBX5272708.1 Gfo/Idh/MocA family oxidoreductase [Rhizobium sp. NLR17b]
MAQRLKIAVTGTGTIVERAHLPGLASDSGVAIFLCGRNSNRLSELSSRFPIEQTFSSFEECLQSMSLDGTIIATPNFLHGEDAFKAISHGLPILLEKPVAHDIAAAREIAARAGQAGVPVHLNLPQPLRPSMQLIKAAIADDRFGQIRSIDVAMLRHAAIPGFGTWFTQKRLSGGGVLADYGPHMLDLALHLAGDYRAKLISAKIWSDLGPKGQGLGDWAAHRNVDDPAAQFDVEDRALLHLETAAGTLITCEVAWAYRGANESRVRLVGDLGGCEYRSDTGDGPVLIMFPSSPLPCAPDHDCLDGPWHLVIKRWLESLRVGERADGLSKGMAVAEIIAQAYEVCCRDER